MPRDAVAVTALTLNSSVDIPAGVTISPTNGANLSIGANTRKVVVRVTNTITNATHTATIKAGVNPPAVRKGLGDLVLAQAASTDKVITLEAARFLQADGTINVDFSTGMTGKISAIRLPKAL